jgi:glucose uptake protein GlcU
MLFKKRQKSEKRNKISHIVAAATTFFHGFEKIDSGHIISALFFFIAGAIFLLIALFHHKLVHRVRSVDAIFSFIEALLAAIIAIDFFNEHKHYIQYAYVLIGLAYFVRSFILFKNPPEHIA